MPTVSAITRLLTNVEKFKLHLFLLEIIIINTN